MKLKKVRKQSMKDGKDFCPRRGKVLVPRNDEVSNCISANISKEAYIVQTVAYSKSTRDKHVDVRGKVNGEANTLSTGDGCSNQSTQNFVARVVIAGTVDPRHGDEDLNWNGYRDGYQVYDKNNLAPALKVCQKALKINTLRIRKLTPTECCRLQGYPDNHLDSGIDQKGEVVKISDNQKYKMAGNGVSSPVSAHILKTMFPSNEEIRVMSLFSGCGGTELGFTDRFKVVGHCEFDKHASSVLKYHYPNIPNFHDATKLVERDDVPQFDLLTFGFPCQALSISGLRKGFGDEKKGKLIFNVFDIIEKHKPKYILAENVKGLLNHNKGETFIEILKGLSSLGYDVDFEVVNSKNFGLAQNRERVFIFGKLK